MKKYLLNRASEAERAALEAAWFSDDEVFEELEATEQDLVDAFARGGLTARDRSALDARAKTSTALRTRIAVARGLLEQTDRGSSQPANDPTPGAPAAPSRLWRWRLALTPAAGLAVLAVAGAMWWLAREPAERTASGGSPTQPGPLEAGRRSDAAPESGRPAPPDEPRPPSPPAVREPPVGPAITVTLFPGLPRSTEQGNAITLSAGTARLELSLEYDGDPYDSYDAVIRTPEGRTAWERSGVKRDRDDRSRVTVTIDATVLDAGEYALTLAGRKPDGTRTQIADYAFRIVRR